MSNLNYQFYPGRIKIDEVVISNSVTKVDVTDLFGELNLNTSINGDTAAAEILIIDSTNIFYKYKIAGGDNISIKISSNDTTREFYFKITGVKNITNLDQQRTYILNCISHLSFKSLHTGIIRSYQGNITEIARQIFDEHATEVEKIGTFEPASNSTKVVVPNWSIIHTFNWLAGKAVWTKDQVRFRFFQDSNMRYNFMPIEKSLETYSERPAFKYTYNLIAGTKGEQQTPNSELTIKAVTDITFKDSFDIKSSMARGKISGIVYSPDIIAKTNNKVVYNYFTNFNKENHLNNFPQYKSNTYEPALTKYDVLTSLVQNEGINKSNDISKIKVSNVDDTQTISIEVKGNTIIEVGQIIELEIASPEPKNDNNKKIDQRYSGKYYVTAKRDIFNRNEHKMYLGLSKESQLESSEQ